MATPGGGDERRVSMMLERLMLQAIADRASDLHFEPQARRLRVRFRIDGVLVDKPGLPVMAIHPAVSRLKVLAGLDISEKRRPQDGGFRFEKGKHAANFRVSTFPTPHGEKVVLRLLSEVSATMGVERLGMNGFLIDQLREIVARPNGIVLVTGPTGSGKTTTLYSLLGELKSDRVNIVTLEDPIEYRLEGITQGQTNKKVGFTFSAGLRSILRQDPDIILVGEMRDAETASIAFRAALTGHLVLSSLHTNSALETIVRLIDMGIERFVIASALRAVVAQRLIRRICPICRVPQRVTESERAKLLMPPMGAVFQAKGCPRCANTGYQGRVGLFELVQVDEEFAELIKDPGTSRKDFQDELARRQVISLRRAGMRMVTKGETTVEEVLRVT